MADFYKYDFGRTKCTLREAENKIACKKSFNASNLHGVAIGRYYIISSYDTVIALAVENEFYITNESYSNVTAKHKAIILRAFKRLPFFEVSPESFNYIINKGEVAK